MLDKPVLQCRYFTSYTGISLPLKLTNPVDGDIQQRIIYFIAYYDDSEQLQKIEKKVYGEIVFTHDYHYDDNGKLVKAVIVDDNEDPRTLIFDAQGQASEL